MELLPEQPTSINCTSPRLLAGLGGDQWTRCQAFAEIRRVYPARQSARVLRGAPENRRDHHAPYRIKWPRRQREHSAGRLQGVQRCPQCRRGGQGRMKLGFRSQLPAHRAVQEKHCRCVAQALSDGRTGAAVALRPRCVIDHDPGVLWPDHVLVGGAAVAQIATGLDGCGNAVADRNELGNRWVRYVKGVATICSGKIRMISSYNVIPTAPAVEGTARHANRLTIWSKRRASLPD